MQGNLLVGQRHRLPGHPAVQAARQGRQLRGDRGRADPLVHRSELPPVRRQDRPRRRDLFHRLAQPDHRPHAAQPARSRAATATHGRVYRVTYEGRPLLKPAKIAGEPIDKLLDLLKEPEDRVRYRAKIELSGRDSEEVIAAVDRWVKGLDKSDPDYEHHLLEALWVHQYHNVVNRDLLERVLASPDFRARAAATRVLCYWRDRVSDALELFKRLAADEHPRVRLEAVRRRQLLYRERSGRNSRDRRRAAHGRIPGLRPRRDAANARSLLENGAGRWAASGVHHRCRRPLPVAQHQ